MMEFLLFRAALGLFGPSGTAGCDLIELLFEKL